VAALAVLLASPAFAQGDRWWRVELLIFSHESAQPAEQWDPSPNLAYPSAARFLVEPGRVEDNLAQYHADSVVDKFGRQILTILPEPDANGATHRNNSDPAPGTTQSGTDIPRDPNTPAIVLAEDMVGQMDEPDPEQIALVPTPFVALPSAQLEFRGKAAYMQRSGKYRTLFHQTWVQPVSDQASTLPIILDRSGDTGQWPRLQGSITLYLSRYLHLETNLWLNTPGDYLPGVWQMPPPPLGPPSLIIEDLPEPELDSHSGDWASDPELPSPLPEEAEGEPLPEEDLGPVYPYRHAVLLQQERRMRSTEVHYIDHPMLGVVAKLTPLTATELEAMAQAEMDSEATQAQ
jgi:hypothetical protein